MSNNNDNNNDNINDQWESDERLKHLYGCQFPHQCGHRNRLCESWCPNNPPRLNKKHTAKKADRAPPDFLTATTFEGAKAGYVFKTGAQGLGYYRDMGEMDFSMHYDSDYVDNDDYYDYGGCWGCGFRGCGDGLCSGCRREA